jgi:hypothetical protein
LNIEGNWIIRVYKDNLEMMLSIQMHLLEWPIMISIDPSFGNACGRQDGNNVIV